MMYCIFCVFPPQSLREIRHQGFELLDIFRIGYFRLLFYLMLLYVSN